MRWLILGTVLTIAAAGCSSYAATPEAETPAPGAEASMETAGPDARFLAEGKQIFDEVCSACHTLNPPPNLAPPMSHVAGHLRGAFETREEALNHIVTFVPAPNAENAIMPEHAIERFGLMAPLPLPAETLEKVAAYVWTLADEAEGMEMGRGTGGEN